jgi:hypothetical protein
MLSVWSTNETHAFITEPPLAPSVSGGVATYVCIVLRSPFARALPPLAPSVSGGVATYVCTVLRSPFARALPPLAFSVSGGVPRAFALSFPPHTLDRNQPMQQCL